jgi:WS/DGAT/MGAT family acyltransferase
MVGHYDRLSVLDNSFLAIESPSTHMHVAALAVFDAGPLRTADGGIDIDRFRRFVASKLPMIPRYRQRTATIPLERRSVWVDDEHFNLEYHVRHTSLPHPGDDEQLMLLMGRISSQQLDRSKPLWEMFVVEGLSDDRFALISKTHHAIIDGVAGADLLTVLLNVTPTEDIDPPEPFVPRPAPTGPDLLIMETARRAGRVAASLRNVRHIGDDAQAVAAEAARKLHAVGQSLSSGWLSMASRTPLNGKVTPNRRFGTLDTDLDEVKAVKNALGGSVNDVVLATVAGGVRRYLLEDHGFAVDDLDFRVMAPVSVRTAGEAGAMGNQVAMWLASLPIAEPDPVSRLAAVSEETTKLKRTDQALGAATLVRLSAGAPTTLLSLASRLATNARPFNMTVTNVPGPQFPLYLLGSKLLATYPLVPLWQEHGAGIALFSYDGTLFWGFNADWDVVPDLRALIEAVAASFGELREAAAAVTADGGAPPVTAKRAPKKRPPLGGIAS